VYWHGIWGFKSEEIYMKVHMTHGTEMHGKIFNPTQNNTTGIIAAQQSAVKGTH